MMGPPDLEVCAKKLLTLKAVCNDLGVPLAQEKQEGPSTKLTSLGITINAIKQMLSLPSEKLARLLETLEHWIQRVRHAHAEN